MTTNGIFLDDGGRITNRGCGFEFAAFVPRI